MYGIIVFEILRIHTYTRKRKVGVFRNLNSGELFWRDAFSVTVFTGYEWTVGQISVLKKNGFVSMGPEPVTFLPFLCPSQSSLLKPGFDLRVKA